MDIWTKHPYERVTYKSGLTDTDKWDHFVPNPGDIFICTPAKSGTTWMQTIVTFLLFRSADLDFIPAERSPWFDMSIVPVEESIARLFADDQRNVIKTHTALDGVPFYEAATYIGVYRDPRDAFFSLRNHMDNMTMETGAEEPDATAQFRSWLELDNTRDEDNYSITAPLHHLKSLWDLRHLPNIHLFHYSDLLRDLKGEMARVAEAIGVEVDDALLVELAEAATFSNMRAKFEKFVPGAKGDFWHEPKEFLKTGTSGQWQGILPPDLVERFDERLRELVGDEMAEWVVGGNDRSLC